jgi:hypothetical protein
MDSSRFKEIGYATSLIPMTLDKESLGYLVKLNCIWLTFQYYFKAFGIKPPKGKAFHDVLMQPDNSEKFVRYRKDLGIPINEYGYPTISSRSLQRIFDVTTINKNFVNKIVDNDNFQLIYLEAIKYFFSDNWANISQLKKTHNRFLKNLLKLASF